ncbi:MULTISPECIES: hypothetical protein [unclassified Rhizobium]|uniref:hypothetical protein n=1 Tax=unclassified Rhizobium TaxID=2613769 RepID=UPI00380A6A37
MASLFSVERGGSQTLWINRQAAIEFHYWTWGAARIRRALKLRIANDAGKG